MIEWERRGSGRGMRCTVREEEDGDGFGFFRKDLLELVQYMNSMYAQPDGSTYPPPVAVSLRYTSVEKS